MIVYAVKPENDFNEFINLYFDECRKNFPKIELIAGKWNFEDLIPGLSDFDTRFICSNDMNVDDWCEMSSIVGQVHLDICKKNKKWIRILEHLPGVNVTWDELTDEYSYYPEYRQWSLYYTDESDKLKKTNDYLLQKPWTARDEYFHLKKFIAYYAPYNPDLDPEINIGEFSSKYPLHSRIMHYLVPPLQSALSILIKKPLRGKLESLRLAKELFPEQSIFSYMLDIIDKHYEVRELSSEYDLKSFDERLFNIQNLLKNELRSHITILKKNSNGDIDDNIDEWKKQIGKIVISPYLKVQDYTRFWKLIKGRFYFYKNAPSYFDSIPLIKNELGRLGDWFYRIPFIEYWYLVTGNRITDPDSILQKLVPDVITSKEADAALELSKLFFYGSKKGREMEISDRLIYILDDFNKGLNKIICLIKEKTRGMFSEI